MADIVHISKQSAAYNRQARTIYRCDRCGFLSYGAEQVEPGDHGPPGLDVQCPCYMGPRWVKGTWRPDRLSATSEGDEA